MSLFSALRSRISPRRKTRSLRSRRRLQMERLESRQMLAGDAMADIAPLSDEFGDSSSLADWLRVNQIENWDADQLQVWDIDQTQPGRMVMQPHTTVWYQNYRGPLVYKEVTGDFIFTSQVIVTDRDDVGGSDGDDVPGDAQFSLGGVMIRTPRNIADPAVDWQPGSMADDGTNNGENYVFLSLGHGIDGQLSLEVKTTRNSDSQLSLSVVGTNVATLRLARVGNAVFALYQLPGQDWVVHRRYERSDMPETLQLGLVTYTDWTKASDFDPFFQNSNVLQAGIDDPTPFEPFNPDLIAGFEYARFARPVVPAELAGVDLVNDALDAQLLSFLGGDSLPAPDPEPDPEPQPFPTIGDQNMAAGDGLLVIELPAAQADGTPLSYSALVLGGQAHELDEQYDFYSDGQYYANWGDQQEKWIHGNGADWFYLLPGGALHQWDGSFAASPLIAVLGDLYYDDPSQLTDPVLPATAELAGNVLTIDPLDGLLGQFEVELAVSNGAASAEETFTVTVFNNAPQWSPIEDQSVPHAQDSLTVELAAADVDGDDVSFSASIVQPVAFQLDQQHSFNNSSDYFDNWGGMQERWILTAEGQWYFLLPGGSLNRWEGSFETSMLVAELGSEFYDDPALLTDAQPIAATVEVVGNVLTVDPDPQYAGSFQVEVVAGDGFSSTSQSFFVNVANQAPVLAEIGDQTMEAGQLSLILPLDAFDPDGDPLSFEVEVINDAYALDQELGLWSDGEYFQNWGGQQEKWLRDQDNQWHYLLPGGEFYRWEGSFESSQLIASLGAAVYDNPALLVDAQPTSATAYILGDMLIIERPIGYQSSFRVRLVVNDGVSSIEETFSVDAL